MREMKAYAKVNLHLRIGERRADGFHSLESIFHKIDLADTLEITVSDAPCSSVLLNSTLSLPPGEQDIILKSAQLFLTRYSENPLQVAISCIKQIPVGGGFGGGSSDAAAALVGLNSVCGSPFSQHELAAMALELGSDIPFFLGSHSAALVTGRGECIEPIPSLGHYSLIILMPDFSVHTGWAYRQLDRTRKRSQTAPLGDLADRYRTACSADPAHWHFTNDFYEVIESAYPIYREISSFLEAQGALFSTLTGSGAGYIAVFPEYADVGEVEKRVGDTFPMLRSSKVETL